MSTGTSARRKQLIDAKKASLLRGLNHPLRIRLLSVLGQRAASPKELATELGEELSNVSYHCRALEKDGLAEIVREEPVRGAIRHTYRATDRPVLEAEDWEKLDPEVRLAALEYGIGKIFTDAMLALKAGTFDRRRGGSHLSRTPFRIDAEGWDRVSAILDGALEEVIAESGRAADRLAGSGEDGIPMTVAILGFEQPAEND